MRWMTLRKYHERKYHERKYDEAVRGATPPGDREVRRGVRLISETSCRPFGCADFGENRVRWLPVFTNLAPDKYLAAPPHRSYGHTSDAGKDGCWYVVSSLLMTSGHTGRALSLLRSSFHLLTYVYSTVAATRLLRNRRSFQAGCHPPKAGGLLRNLACVSSQTSEVSETWEVSVARCGSMNRYDRLPASRGSVFRPRFATMHSKVRSSVDGVILCTRRPAQMYDHVCERLPGGGIDSLPRLPVRPRQLSHPKSTQRQRRGSSVAPSVVSMERRRCDTFKNRLEPRPGGHTGRALSLLRSSFHLLTYVYSTVAATRLLRNRRSFPAGCHPPKTGVC
jgi:hypothetical protein